MGDVASFKDEVLSSRDASAGADQVGASDEAVACGPGLGVALGLMTIGALVASFWWAVVLWVLAGRWTSSTSGELEDERREALVALMMTGGVG